MDAELDALAGAQLGAVLVAHSVAQPDGLPNGQPVAVGVARVVAESVQSCLVRHAAVTTRSSHARVVGQQTPTPRVALACRQSNGRCQKATCTDHEILDNCRSTRLWH